MLVVWSALALGADDCDPARHVDRALSSAASYLLSEAQADLAEAERALACGPAAEPELVARWWLAQGAIWHLQDDARAATAWVNARTVDPDVEWYADLGSKMQQVFDAAAAEPAPLELVVRGAAEEGWLRVDGRLWPGPTLTQGLHLVQAGREEPGCFAAVVWTDTPQAAVLVDPPCGRTLDGPRRADPVIGSTTTRPSIGRPLVWAGLATGLAGVAVATGTFAAVVSQNPAPERDAGMIAANSTGWALGLSGATVFGVGLAIELGGKK